jgi:hypothetical protein
MFDTFQVVFARDRAVALIDEHGSDLHENVLIHAEASGKLILVLVSQMSLRRYFAQPPVDIEPAPASLTLAEWNQVVDRNIDAFDRALHVQERPDAHAHECVSANLHRPIHRGARNARE